MIPGERKGSISLSSSRLAFRLGFGRFASGDWIGMPSADAAQLHPLPQQCSRTLTIIYVVQHAHQLQ